ncbi:hypothetical protein QSJ19_22865 [Gordonia sp. ABSL11-1]|uniref:hypothetical protein n=1 Tax=Gordonia sp. ABSL11-1 TaxID=3053924 RepID=UPI0025732448|nr:hypothetical protein [Gordonia sp. ABSL11-1]MDL9948367.1 hypothetical protein [Gordonia sp. ABSL11-1]
MPTRIDHLPPPADLAPAWSAIAATLATRGPRWATSAFARGAFWHHDDGGGNWADLVHGDDAGRVFAGLTPDIDPTAAVAAARAFRPV